MVRKIYISILILITIFALNSIHTSMVRAASESCGISANAGYNESNAKYRVNVRINVELLEKNFPYDLSVNTDGYVFSDNISIILDGTEKEIQRSFDLDDRSSGVSLGIYRQFGTPNTPPICSTHINLSHDQPPVDNGDLPVSPGTGNIFCGDEKSLNTAIGCIPISSAGDLAAFFLKWAVGIGGGVAFLLMIVGGFTVMTSTGNPERLKGGQQLLTSAVMGLITIIFSVFLLRVIGVNILQIPGLGG